MSAKYGVNAMTQPMIIGEYWVRINNMPLPFATLLCGPRELLCRFQRGGKLNRQALIGLVIFISIILTGIICVIFCSISVVRSLRSACFVSAAAQKRQRLLFSILAVQVIIDRFFLSYKNIFLFYEPTYRIIAEVLFLTVVNYSWNLSFSIKMKQYKKWNNSKLHRQSSLSLSSTSQWPFISLFRC